MLLRRLVRYLRRAAAGQGRPGVAGRGVPPPPPPAPVPGPPRLQNVARQPASLRPSLVAALGLPGRCDVLRAEAWRRLSPEEAWRVLVSVQRPGGVPVGLLRQALRRRAMAARADELSLLDEALARCAPRADGPALAALLGAPLVFEHRHPRFVASLADCLPGKADALDPAPMALVAKYLARHRLREPRLLDSLGLFLLTRMEELNSKVIQKLVFPFSRMSYQPSNHARLFPLLEKVLEQKAGASPLATVNILMSLVQLRHFPLLALQKVFAPAFLANVTRGSCGLIMRRYLSLLDAAVVLEVPEYEGPRLDPQYRVCMFDGALTADEANRKYSYKSLVAEALRQLVGEERFQQDEVLPPGYCTDFLLWITCSGRVLPLSRTSGALPATSDTQLLPADVQSLPPFKTPRSVCVQGEGQPPLSRTDSYCSQSKGRSSLLTHLSPDPCLHNATCSGFPIEAATSDVSQLLSAPSARVGEKVHRVVLSVNDKWHYCQDGDVLVGSRTMCHRHLRLLGCHVVQLSYTELAQVQDIEGAKEYLWQKLRELHLCGGQQML